jgi:hypothetical protein
MADNKRVIYPAVVQGQPIGDSAAFLSLGMSPPKVGANRYFPAAVGDKEKSQRAQNAVINSATANGLKKIPTSRQPVRNPNSFSAYSKR